MQEEGKESKICVWSNFVLCVWCPILLSRLNVSRIGVLVSLKALLDYKAFSTCYLVCKKPL